MGAAWQSEVPGVSIMTDEETAKSLLTLDDYLSSYVISDDTPFEPMEFWGHVIEIGGVVTHLAKLAESTFRTTALNYKDALYTQSHVEQLEYARAMLRAKPRNELPKET